MARLQGKCCVIGGTGFIGRPLVKALLASGRALVVVGRRPAPKSLPAQVQYIQADISDSSTLRNAFAGVSEVVDLAYGTVPKTSFDDPVADILKNLPSTVGMMEVLAEAAIDKFVYVSSGGTVYGEADALPITELHPTRPISPYGVTKLASERYVDLYRVCNGLPAIVVRPANAYGEEQTGELGQGFIAAAIQGFLRRQPIIVFGEHGTIRDFTHVEDIASGIVAALDHGKTGETYNIGTGIGSSNIDILEQLERLARTSGIDAPTIHFKPPRSFDVSRNVLDAAKLRQVSEWQPQVSLADGLGRCWRYALARDEQSKTR